MHLNLFEVTIGVAVALSMPVVAISLSAAPPGTAPLAAAEAVAIAAGEIDYPIPGEFLLGGRPVSAPSARERVAHFSIMKRQVGLAEYARCVAEGACKPAEARRTDADVPVTGVSWLDANAYARWYSAKTGETWRLPTAPEAAAAAAERFGAEPFSAAADDAANPAVRWIRRYREEAAAKRPADPVPKPRGHYGPNSKGIEDFGGNVWEWTSTCYQHVALAPDGSTTVSAIENCGVHVLEGRHRAYMPNFVRDGKGGGCAVGTPPENLGFRLVRETADLSSAEWLA